MSTGQRLCLIVGCLGIAWNCLYPPLQPIPGEYGPRDMRSVRHRLVFDRSLNSGYHGAVRIELGELMAVNILVASTAVALFLCLGWLQAGPPDDPPRPPAAQSSPAGR